MKKPQEQELQRNTTDRETFVKDVTGGIKTK